MLWLMARTTKQTRDSHGCRSWKYHPSIRPPGVHHTGGTDHLAAWQTYKHREMFSLKGWLKYSWYYNSSQDSTSDLSHMSKFSYQGAGSFLFSLRAGWTPHIGSMSPIPWCFTRGYPRTSTHPLAHSCTALVAHSHVLQFPRWWWCLAHWLQPWTSSPNHTASKQAKRQKSKIFPFQASKRISKTKGNTAVKHV